MQTEGLEQLYEPLFRHLLKVKVNDKEVYQIIGLSDIETDNLESDEEWLDKIRVYQVDEVVTDADKSMETHNGDFRRVIYPRIPEFKQTSYMRMMMLSNMAAPGNKENENYEERKAFTNTCNRYLARKQTAGFFFKRALLWAYGNKWANYPADSRGTIPDEALDDFLEEMKAEMKEYLDAQRLKGKVKNRRSPNSMRNTRLPKSQAVPPLLFRIRWPQKSWQRKNPSHHAAKSSNP